MKSILRTEALGLTVGVALLSVNSSAWSRVTNVPKWSVHEITLNSLSRYTNPYTQLRVMATFQGPGNIKKTVPGFWDGGNTFKIRFTPTAEGIWTYSTSSADAGLNGKTGTIKAIAPLVGNHGFVRRDAKYRHHFVYDDGTRYFMFGNTYYEILENAAGGNRWKQAVNETARMGMTKIRMNLGGGSTNERGANHPSSTPYGSNHDTLNLSHWRRLDEVIAYMASKGVVADLLFFWQNPNNYGTQAQDERFVRYAMARYAAYPNVIWCVVNEWEYINKPTSYWNTLGNIIRTTDPWSSQGAFLRPLSIHQRTRINFYYANTSWPVHVIIQYGVRNPAASPAGTPKYANGDEWGYAAIRYNWGHNMPVVNDEYGYIREPDDVSVSGAPTLTRRKHRQIIWGIYTAGGYGSAGDKHKYSDGQPYFDANWHHRAEYDDIKRLIDFFTTKGIEYWKMTTDPALKTSGTRVYVLAEPGQQYVMYAAVGGKFSVNVAPGTYTARRYNPVTGEDIALANITGGGNQSFALPDSKDWVVYLRRVRQ